ncbi:DNA ligase [Shewanella putrefaciens]|uniref:DNA ligase n=1 Tax=Shewanella putrefaciens TaxID=24 RepID=A0ABX8XGQ1_SHEPU|nr:DNA ligase [Shewanella putrefaciens]MCT8941941.1 DNA ligase [Shewanella putrefaciens]QSE50994.1 DNA ligase [Shewanella putrefaciens]QYX74405.1 DNA ligase [Shewanella putrefaciens]GGN16704.1 ATP-dependent DNA ligase [Shewanella putrefaciens]
MTHTSQLFLLISNSFILLRLLSVSLLLVCLSVNANPSAPKIQLATELTADKTSYDIREFLISEKLDGVRGYWTGHRLVTRQGYPINAPVWFTADFPAIPIDGELWLGRGQFEAISSLIRQSSPKEDAWRNVRFMVFDLPKAEGNFEQRYRLAIKMFAGKSAYIEVIEQFQLDSIEALYQKLDSLVVLGAEGLMLHRRSAYYIAGRNPNLMKLKPYFDAEAKVIAHIAGKGQFAGQMGALKVQTPDGRIFSIGTGFSLAERQHPPAVGTIITYKYLGLTVNGLPRFASFLRVRTDIVESPLDGGVDRSGQ